jgi:hypothetical protein
MTLPFFIQNFTLFLTNHCHNNHEWIKDHSKYLHSDHSEFEQVAAVAYNENTINGKAQQATANVILNRAKNNTITKVLSKMAGGKTGLTHSARLKSTSTFKNYAKFFNKSLGDRNNDIGMKSANSSTIKAFLGEDITGGAVYEKGRDWFDSRKRKIDDKHWPDYIEAQEQGYTWDEKGGVFTGDYTPKTHPSHIGTVSKDYKYLITAGFDGNVFMKINPEFEKNKQKNKIQKKPE